jgi:hypothetical protein
MLRRDLSPGHWGSADAILEHRIDPNRGRLRSEQRREWLFLGSGCEIVIMPGCSREAGLGGTLAVALS